MSTNRPTQIIATYDYVDETGTVIYQNCRTKPKDFFHRRPDGNGGWTNDLNGIDRLLFHLSELLESTTQDFVWIVEGEKDVLTLEAAAFTATTSGSSSSWKPEFAAHFKSRLVYISPDNDMPGKRYADTVAKSLHGVAREIRMIELPHLGDGEDISDWLPRHSVEELHKIVDATKPYEPPTSEPYQPVIVKLSDIDVKPIRWLWRDRIPHSATTALAGPPGLGKTTLSFDISARVSAGRPFPDSPDFKVKAGGVILLLAEDTLADVVKPRLMAANANLDNISAIVAVRENNDKGKPIDEVSFDLKRHIRVLQQEIDRQGNTRLIVIDPITAFMGATDCHKNSDVRGVLKGLSRIAEDNDVAIICINHHTKGQGSSADAKILGSVAFSAVARTVWHIAQDPKDEDRRLFLPGKNNLAKNPKGLAFRLVGTEDGDITSVKVEYEDEAVDLTADDVFCPDRDENGNTILRVDEAAKWLREILPPDTSKSASSIFEQGDERGFSIDLLRRAKNKLGVKIRKDGYGGKSVWSLSDD